MVRFSGFSGELRHSYQRAAVLNRWKLEHGVLEATPSEVDEFWLSQRPLDLIIDIGQKSRWRWRNVQLLECDKVARVRVDGSPQTLRR